MSPINSRNVIFLLASLFVGAGGCQAIGGPVDVEALVMDDEGLMRLGTTRLSSVTDLHAGVGEDFSIIGGLTLNLLHDTEDFGVLELQTGYDSWDDMVANARKGAQSSPLALSLSNDGAQYVGDDYEALAYLTSFSNYEKTHQFVFEHFDTSLAPSLSADFVVGFYGFLGMHPAVPVRLGPATDNAAYVSVIDGFLTVPNLLAGGIPISLDHSVTAHEYGHRLFAHFAYFGPAFSAWQNQTDPKSAGAQALLSGVDEGFSDLVAVMVSGSPTFTEHTFVDAIGLGAFEATHEQRTLEGDFAEGLSYEALQGGLEECGGPMPPPDEVSAPDAAPGGSFNFYCLGTLFAKTVYDAAGSAEALRDGWAFPLSRALVRLGEVMAENSPEDGSYLVFRPSDLMETLAAELADEQRVSFCDEVAIRFSSPLLDGEIPSCI